MIELHDVVLRIGGRELLRNLNACVRTGEFVALVGPNGIGKTTLLRSIAGMHPVAAGDIRIDERDATRLAPLERARHIAFVTGDEVLLDALRVRDVVAIGRFPYHRWWQWQAHARDDDAVAGALAAVQMEALADRLVSTLSTGERQRAWIAMGLAQATPVLLLDEPTSHLDVRVAHEILTLLRDLASGPAPGAKTVICSLHDLNDAAAYADRIALLCDGQLAALAAPDEVLSSGLLERTYGIGMERVRLADGRTRVFAVQRRHPPVVETGQRCKRE